MRLCLASACFCDHEELMLIVVSLQHHHTISSVCGQGFPAFMACHVDCDIKCVSNRDSRDELSWQLGGTVKHHPSTTSSLNSNLLSAISGR